MPQDEINRLPYNARGMDFDGFAWEVRPDGKIHLFAKEKGGFHWTLHPGTRSGALDLHETAINPDGTTSHRTLFMIKLEDCERLASELAPVLIPGLLEQFRPLSLRWVRRRRISIIRDPSSTNAELRSVTFKTHKRLRFEPQKLEEAQGRVTAPERILALPDGWFRLMSVRRRGTRWLGVGLKATDRTGEPHLLWARPEDLIVWGEQMQEFMMCTARKYLISRDDYPKYLGSSTASPSLAEGQ